MDDLVLRDRSTSGTLNERLYALQDANWNVTAVTDAAGAVQERYEYDPYGVTTPLSPTFEGRSTSAYDWETTYAGYRRDAATGLFAVRNRYYHPMLGTWVTRDPVASGHNLYHYGRPLVATDPEGLWEPGAWSAWGIHKSTSRGAETVCPLGPGQSAPAGQMTWTQDGNRFAVSRQLTQDWQISTSRTGDEEFASYWDPSSFDQGNVEAKIRLKANWWNHQQGIMDGTLDPLEGGRQREQLKRDLMGRDLDRATRGADVACTAGSLGGAVGKGLLSGLRGMPRKLPKKLKTQTIYKAPQPGKGQKLLKQGFLAEDFSEGDLRAYFAKERPLAEEYANHYGEGVMEVDVLQFIYNTRLRHHEMPYISNPSLTELPIPHDDYDVLNESVRKLYGH